jgi:hypothetical protein
VCGLLLRAVLLLTAGTGDVTIWKVWSFGAATAPLCWTVSAVLSLNLVLFYGFGRDFPKVIDRTWTMIDASVLLAFANLAAFVWATRMVGAEGSRLTPQASSR